MRCWSSPIWRATSAAVWRTIVWTAGLATRRCWFSCAVRISVSWRRRVTRARNCCWLRGARHERRRLLDLRIPGDHARVDRVGLLQPTHALRELAHGARVEDGHRQVVFGKLREGSPLVAAGSFHGDQFDLMGLAEGGQRGDAFDGVGKRCRRAVAADARFQ